MTLETKYFNRFFETFELAIKKCLVFWPLSKVYKKISTKKVDLKIFAKFVNFASKLYFRKNFRPVASEKQMASDISPPVLLKISKGAEIWSAKSAKTL